MTQTESHFTNVHTQNYSNVFYMVRRYYTQKCSNTHLLHLEHCIYTYIKCTLVQYMNILQDSENYQRLQ